MRRWLVAAVSGVATAAACVGWGLGEASAFTVRRISLDVLPPGGGPLRILHVSDVHLMARQRRKLQFLRRLALLKPDLVINTGDNIAEAEAVPLLDEAWGDLRNVPGAFVFGSNDYFSPTLRNPLSYVLGGPSRHHRTSSDLPWRDLARRMESSGWVNVMHRRTMVEVNGYRVALRGTDDAHLNRDDYSTVAGPAEDDSADLSLGVTHAPYRRVLDAMTGDGVDLIFAGHTHGGQVCVPGYGALITNCDLDTPRVKGLSRHAAGGKTSALHVSAGVGTSPFAPYRFACRPEVTLLTLRPSSQNAAR